MQLDFSNKPKVKAAYDLAERWHRDQTRKYTGEPYINHPVEVAEILLKYGHTDEDTLCAALLHDVLEDTDCGEWCISDTCGPRVLRWVKELTDTEVGNRTTRKQMSANRLGRAHHTAQTIKCADLISNTKSIVEYDPKFARVYLEEKRVILAAMNEASPRLKAEADRVMMDGFHKLAMLDLTTGQARQAKEIADDKEIAAILMAEEIREMADCAMF